MLLALAPAFAASLAGDFLTIDYNAGGTWNDAATGHGLQATFGADVVEFTYAGTPYQVWTVGYTADGEWRTYGANSAGTTSVLVRSGTDTSAGSELSTTWTYTTGDVEIEKKEWFDERDIVIGVQFTLTNIGRGAVEDSELLFGFDPDPDATAYADYSTTNDVYDATGDGVDDWASASGASSGLTIGLGACPDGNQSVGFWADWQSNSAVDVTLSDPEGALSDSAVGLRFAPPRTLASGESVAWRFVVALGESPEQATDGYLNLAAELCCDEDGDGAASTACGGPDCDDSTSQIQPAAPDTPYDGIDQDCSGHDADDLDGDGEVGAQAGGTDCDDADATVFSLAGEVWYDGVDQNCDGNDDDEDLDGAPLAYDCDDQDPSIQVDCPLPDTGSAPVKTGDGCACAHADPRSSLAAAGAALVALAIRRRARSG